MKGAVSSILLLATLSVLTACSSRSLNTEVTRCVFPDSPRTPAPSFICDSKISGFPVTALRSSAPDDVSVSERIGLVFDEQIKLWASQWSTQWYLIESEQRQANGFLLGLLQERSRVVRSRISPKSHLWLLIGVSMSLEEIQALTLSEIPPTP